MTNSEAIGRYAFLVGRLDQNCLFVEKTLARALLSRLFGCWQRQLSKSYTPPTNYRCPTVEHVHKGHYRAFSLSAKYVLGSHLVVAQLTYAKLRKSSDSGVFEVIGSVWS